MTVSPALIQRSAGTMGPIEAAWAFGHHEGDETPEEVNELREAVWRLVVTAKSRIRAVMMLTVQGYSQSSSTSPSR